MDSESVKIVGDNVELTNDETKEKQIFKIFLDKDKKNIIKLQDSKTRRSSSNGGFLLSNCWYIV